MPGPGGMSLLDMMNDQPAQPPPQNWPRAIGAPFQYAAGGPSGPGIPQGGQIVGGDRSLEDFYQANRGPMGFFTFDEIGQTPTGPPQEVPGTRMVNGRGPTLIPRVGTPANLSAAAGPGQAGWSTNNPYLMEAMGYKPIGANPYGGNEYQYAVPPSAFGGGKNLGQWIMRGGSHIYTPGHDAWRGQLPETSGNPVRGGAFGFPVGVANITGAAYPVTNWFWPGGDTHYVDDPRVT